MQSYKTVEFEGVSIDIDTERLKEDVIDIDFYNEMMVQFEKKPDGNFIARNGINGYGQNIAEEVKGKQLIIK